MKNPFSDMSRPKALGFAGVAAGALTLSAGAAALNVGLLGADPAPTFDSTPVVETGAVVDDTTTTAPPVEVVYQDVFETVPAAPVARGAVQAVAPSRSGVVSASSSTSDDSDDRDEIESSDDSDDRDEIETDDHERDDRDHEADDDDAEDHSEIDD